MLVKPAILKISRMWSLSAASARLPLVFCKLLAVEINTRRPILLI